MKTVVICSPKMNCLLTACPQHYICWSELPVPRIAVTFSLREVEEIERDCAVYRGRLERIAKNSAISREEQVLRHMHVIPIHHHLTCDVHHELLLILLLPSYA